MTEVNPPEVHVDLEWGEYTAAEMRSRSHLVVLKYVIVDYFAADLLCVFLFSFAVQLVFGYVVDRILL
jgi:hypothetical protein